MLNQIVIVGRLNKDPEIIKEDEKNMCNIELIVQRAYKNEKGEYETDKVPVTLYQGIADNTAEYCHKGDIIGVKGRIQVINDKLNIVAEKITFLASKKENE